MRTKAVQFMAKKGWLEVTEKNIIWTNFHILVLHNPEDMSIGRDEYGDNKYLKPGKYIYECKQFLPATKEDSFPDLDKPVKNLDEKTFQKAEIKREYNYIKLLKLSDEKGKLVMEFVSDGKSVFMDYEYYCYLINEKHVWIVDEWKIGKKEEPILAYCGGMLLALIMPINLRIEEKENENG